MTKVKSSKILRIRIQKLYRVVYIAIESLIIIVIITTERQFDG